MALSYFLANKLLDHVLRNIPYTPPTTVYLALFTTMPLADGTGGVEVVGGSYARQAITFAGPVNGLAASTAVVTFSSMPGVTVVGACLFDASTAGNLLHLGPFRQPASVVSGADFVVPVADAVAVMR